MSDHDNEEEQSESLLSGEEKKIPARPTKTATTDQPQQQDQQPTLSDDGEEMEESFVRH